jgi:hypothetical protein
LLSTTVTTNCATANASSSSTGHGGDEGALLAFKAKISRHSAGVLDSWNQSTSYCNWEGIGCSSRRNRWHRVVTLDLSSQGLDGAISPAFMILLPDR